MVAVLIAAGGTIAALAGRPDEPGAASSPVPAGARAEGVALRIVGGPPSSWNPALIGDAGSASTLAQVYEGLTAFDANTAVQPALAERWRVEDDGRRMTFQLRPDLRFSDGSALTGEDVVASWLRLIDPAQPSPLASLLADVSGAADYQAGRVGVSGVGLRAEGDLVIVEFQRPASYFLSVTASPSLAVVPSDAGDAADGPDMPSDLVVSGAYRPTAQSENTITLDANPSYWAGSPPLDRIEIVTDLGGKSPVEAFEDGDVDYTQIFEFDAPWIRYDRTLGPQLRTHESLSVDYFGFDTSRPPFDDAAVRRAFAGAVDWDRLVSLSRGADALPATSLVPPGIPGRGETDVTPVHDPDAARAELAAAGYPAGEGFPATTLISSGIGYEEAVADELERTLQVEVEVETMPFGDYVNRLDTDPPAFFALTWIADYPAPHDFLGLLLETGSSSNEGRWTNDAYDAALEAAAATTNPAEQEAHYAEAQRIIQREAPLVPVSYGRTWSLSRSDLLGATESGVGFLRFASLDWAVP